jgi:hypothetical protein
MTDEFTFEYLGKIYNVSGNNRLTRHGGPFDRGSADNYYWRPEDPHWWPEGTSYGIRVEKDEMSQDEIEEYYAGYEYNERYGGKKDWG